MRNDVILETLQFDALFQTKKSEWGRTTLSYTSEKSLRLPITDVALRDIGRADQEFWLEVGMVCFK